MILKPTKHEAIKDFEVYWMFGITSDEMFQGSPCLDGHGSRKPTEAG
jgi:hypothetical protein